MSCKAFFEKHANSDISKELQKLDIETQLAWESESASDLSPGPINDHEKLVRHWLSPFHYDEATNRLAPTAFDDVANKGLSTNRLMHAPIDQQHQVARERVETWKANNKGKGRELIGYSVFEASEARTVLTSEPFAPRPPCANMTCCSWLREISEQRGSYVQDPSTKGFHARSAVSPRFSRIARSP